jgi:hypothetical protein
MTAAETARAAAAWVSTLGVADARLLVEAAAAYVRRFEEGARWFAWATRARPGTGP